MIRRSWRATSTAHAQDRAATFAEAHGSSVMVPGDIPPTLADAIVATGASSRLTPRLRQLLGAASVALLFAGCPAGQPGPTRLDRDGIPIEAVSYNFVNSRPAGHLEYPGSRVFRIIGRGYAASDHNRVGAHAGAVMRVDASPEQIYAWYQDWFSQHGWIGPILIGGNNVLISVKQYRRHSRELFEVGMDDPRDLDFPTGSGGTLYQADYTIIPVSP